MEFTVSLTYPLLFPFWISKKGFSKPTIVFFPGERNLKTKQNILRDGQGSCIFHFFPCEYMSTYPLAYIYIYIYIRYADY